MQREAVIFEALIRLLTDGEFVKKRRGKPGISNAWDMYSHMSATKYTNRIILIEMFTCNEMSEARIICVRYQRLTSYISVYIAVCVVKKSMHDAKAKRIMILFSRDVRDY